MDLGARGGRSGRDRARGARGPRRPALAGGGDRAGAGRGDGPAPGRGQRPHLRVTTPVGAAQRGGDSQRSEEHTSELQSRGHLVCRLLLEKKKKNKIDYTSSSVYTIDKHTIITVDHTQ